MAEVEAVVAEDILAARAMLAALLAVLDMQAVAALLAVSDMQAVAALLVVLAISAVQVM